jgi:hypothetical protein
MVPAIPVNLDAEPTQVDLGVESLTSDEWHAIRS